MLGHLLIVLVSLSIENAQVDAATHRLDNSLKQIAVDIGQLSKEFPQLSRWQKDADLNSDSIEYQYHYKERKYPFGGNRFGRNGCYLSIQSRKDLDETLNLGFKIHFQAVGPKADILKNRLSKIIEKNMESLKKTAEETDLDGSTDTKGD